MIFRGFLILNESGTNSEGGGTLMVKKLKELLGNYFIST
jgi:hypothetical protein